MSTTQPATLKQFAKFTNTTAGLDLTLRLIHSIAIILSNSPVQDGHVKMCSVTSSQLTIGRRYLRLFCFLDCFYKSHELVTKSSSNNGRMSMVRTFEIIESTLLGLYLALEGTTMLHDMGVQTVDWYTPVLVEANKLWLYSIAFNVLRTVWILVVGPESSETANASEEKPKGEKPTAEVSAPSQPPPTALQSLRRLVVGVCDLTLPASFLGWLPLSDFEVGLAMFISTVLVWSDLWNAVQ